MKVIITILNQLELGEVRYIKLLPQINVTCVLNFHQTSPPILASGDVVVAAILKKSEMKDGQYVFHIPSVANSIRVQALELTNHLQSLKDYKEAARLRDSLKVFEEEEPALQIAKRGHCTGKI